MTTSDEMRKRIGLCIRHYREEKGISQSELARILQPQVSQATVCDWERGRTSPSTERMPSVANALDVTINQLYGEDS